MPLVGCGCCCLSWLELLVSSGWSYWSEIASEDVGNDTCSSSWLASELVVNNEFDSYSATASSIVITEETVSEIVGVMELPLLLLRLLVLTPLFVLNTNCDWGTWGEIVLSPKWEEYRIGVLGTMPSPSSTEKGTSWVINGFGGESMFVDGGMIKRGAIKWEAWLADDRSDESIKLLLLRICDCEASELDKVATSVLEALWWWERGKEALGAGSIIAEVEWSWNEIDRGRDRSCAIRNKTEAKIDLN